MRICQLTHVETHFDFLTPLFHALARDGHEVVAASNLDQGGELLRRNLGSEFEIHKIKVSRKVTLRACTTEVVQLARYLAREKFDVVHVHNALAATQGRLAARLARVPVVINHVHGYYFHDGTRPLPRLALVAMEWVLARFFTDYTITVNEEDRQFASSHGFAPDPEKIVGTPGVGIDTQRFSPDNRLDGIEIRREQGIPADDLVVTFVGRLVAEKGVLELGEAFSGLLRERPAWLWLVGDVSPTERDQTAVHRLEEMLRADPEAARRTIRFGRRQDIPQILAASDILVLPSYREGMPVSVLEAMASEVPVITTDVRGCREAVAGGAAGVLVPPRDPGALTEALRKLSADPDERRRLGLAGRARVEECNATTLSVAPVLALYRRIEASVEEAVQHRGGRFRRIARRILPGAVRKALSSDPAWRIAVQHVTDPLTRTPDSTHRVLSDEALETLGLACIADPFAVRHDGSWYLFFEQIRTGTDRGEIGVAESPDLQNWTYRGTALAEPFHLSYPHIVEADGEIYMIPEASASGSVRLYRAAGFPLKWDLVDVILDGHKFKDSTLVERDGNYFLFTETSAKDTHDELRLFAASGLHGPWTEHPASPLVVGNADAARPAGGVVNIDRRLVRLSQRCAQRYGGGVLAHPIERMDLDEYRESPGAQEVLRPAASDWTAGGTHHIDAHLMPDGGWIRFVDGHP